MIRHHMRILLLLAALVAVAEPALADSTADQEFQTQLALALQGKADSQYRIGEMYEFGIGTRRDPAMAYLWYNKAATQGNGRARDKLANWDNDRGATVEEQSRVDATMRALQQGEQEAARQREKAAAEARNREKAAAEATAAAHARPRAPAPALTPKPATPPSPAVIKTPVKAPAPVAEAVATTPTQKALPAAKTADKTKQPNPVEFSANPCKGPQAKFLSTCN